MPEFEMAAPCDVGGRWYEEAASQVQRQSEIAAIEAVDKHAAKKWNEKAGQCDDDNLQADFHRGMRGGHDVPADAHEIHAASKKRNEHRRKEIPEAALRPDQLPVHTGCCCGCHGAL